MDKELEVFVKEQGLAQTLHYMARTLSIDKGFCQVIEDAALKITELENHISESWEKDYRKGVHYMKPKVEIKPGILALMVGPSSAGKSTYADNLLSENEHLVISSDSLRHRLTGNFKDQSKNDEVWSIIHSLIEANIKLGVNVLLDATNIKNTNRRAILDLVPENTTIHYYVIDRPLADKIRDGGYRNGVIIKGMSLIQHHHNVMQSNLSTILAGDNDPRVTVFDMRRT